MEVTMARKKSAKSAAEGDRKWLDLPCGPLLLIFEMIGTANIFLSAQLVCRHWWLLAHEPYLYRRIVILGECGRSRRRLLPRHSLEIALAAVDRSDGCLVEFSILKCATDQLLERIAARSSSSLKILRLINCSQISGSVLLKACASLPLLEEVDISSTFVRSEVATSGIGRLCPNLKTFRSSVPNARFWLSNNRVALAVAKNMRGLRELEIVGNRLNNYGLRAILNRCTRLESLDIRGCYKANFGRKLKKRYAMLKSVKGPRESTYDYPYELDISMFYGDADCPIAIYDAS